MKADMVRFITSNGVAIAASCPILDVRGTSFCCIRQEASGNELLTLMPLQDGMLCDLRSKAYVLARSAPEEGAQAIRLSSYADERLVRSLKDQGLIRRAWLAETIADRWYCEIRNPRSFPRLADLEHAAELECLRNPAAKTAARALILSENLERALDDPQAEATDLAGAIEQAIKELRSIADEGRGFSLREPPQEGPAREER